MWFDTYNSAKMLHFRMEKAGPARFALRAGRCLPGWSRGVGRTETRTRHAASVGSRPADSKIHWAAFTETRGGCVLVFGIAYTQRRCLAVPPADEATHATHVHLPDLHAVVRGLVARAVDLAIAEAELKPPRAPTAKSARVEREPAPDSVQLAAI